jgi:phage terminase small subunit
MPAHRKNLDILAANGATAHDPQRFRDRKPSPKVDRPLGSAPKRLSPAEQAAWKEIKEQAADGILTIADRAAVEMAARLMAGSWAGALSAAEKSIYVSLLARFGMTPMDRNKLPATSTQKPDETDDPWNFVRRPGNAVRAGRNQRQDPGVQVGSARVSETLN